MQQDSPIQTIQDVARRNKIFAEYRLEKESGPAHAKMYTVRLHLGNKEYVGTERSIKLAQHAAAQVALNDHRSLSLTNNYDQDISQINVVQSPTTALNTWATRNHISTRYVLLNEQFLSTSPNRSRILFHYRLYLGHDLYFDGHAPTHQQARINCALNAFYFLRQNQITPPSTPQSNFPCSPTSKSEISLMYERAKQLGLPVRIEFVDRFTVTYHIGEKYSATGKGFNRHSAKQSAAEKMLKILPLTNIQQNLNPITRIYQLAQLRQVKIEFIQLFNKENFIYQIKFGEHETAQGQGKTKQIAKRLAAEALLDKFDPIVVLPPPPAKGLLKRDGNNENLNKQEKKHVHFVEEVIEKDEQISPRPLSTNISQSNKQQLIDACQKLQIHVEYLDEMNQNENSSSSRYQSIVSLAKNERLLAQFRGYGPSIIRAQDNASSAAWNNLKQLFNGSISTPCQLSIIGDTAKCIGELADENIEFTDQIYSSSTVHKITKIIPEIYGGVDINKHKRVGAFSGTDCHLPYKVTCTNEGTSDFINVNPNNNRDKGINQLDSVNTRELDLIDNIYNDDLGHKDA